MIKLAVFDMDGVVLNSMPQLRELGVHIIQESFQVARIEAQKAYDRTVGMSFRSQLDHVQLEVIDVGVNDAIAKQYAEGHKTLCQFFKVSRYFDSFLDWREMPQHTALISSTDSDIIHNHLPQVIGLPFNFILGRSQIRIDDTSIRLEKADQLMCLQTVLHLKSDEILFFGDTPRDECIANSLDIHFKLVTTDSFHHIPFKELMRTE